jgi:hypothetical protein
MGSLERRDKKAPDPIRTRAIFDRIIANGTQNVLIFDTEAARAERRALADEDREFLRAFDIICAEESACRQMPTSPATAAEVDEFENQLLAAIAIEQAEHLLVHRRLPSSGQSWCGTCKRPLAVTRDGRVEFIPAPAFKRCCLQCVVRNPDVLERASFLAGFWGRHFRSHRHFTSLYDGTDVNEEEGAG